MGARGSREERQPQHQSLEMRWGEAGLPPGQGVGSSSHSVQVLEERLPKDSYLSLNELNFCATDTSQVKGVSASSECRLPR